MSSPLCWNYRCAVVTTLPLQSTAICTALPFWVHVPRYIPFFCETALRDGAVLGLPLGETVGALKRRAFLRFAHGIDVGLAGIHKLGLRNTAPRSPWFGCQPASTLRSALICDRRARRRCWRQPLFHTPDIRHRAQPSWARRGPIAVSTTATAILSIKTSDIFKRDTSPQGITSGPATVANLEKNGGANALRGTAALALKAKTWGNCGYRGGWETRMMGAGCRQTTRRCSCGLSCFQDAGWATATRTWQRRSKVD